MSFKGKCTNAKIKECEEKIKKCNPITGRCGEKNYVEKQTSRQPKQQLKQEEIKTIRDFIKELKQYKTTKEAIEKIFTII